MSLETENRIAHYQFRKQIFPFLRPHQLNKKCYTDTLKWRISGKVKYTQIFFLAKSIMVVCISITYVVKAYTAYEDFFVNYDTHTRIVSDNCQAKDKSKKIMALLSEYQVKRGFTVAG